MTKYTLITIWDGSNCVNDYKYYRIDVDYKYIYKENYYGI